MGEHRAEVGGLRRHLLVHVDSSAKVKWTFTSNGPGSLRNVHVVLKRRHADSTRSVANAQQPRHPVPYPTGYHAKELKRHRNGFKRLWMLGLLSRLHVWI